MRTVHALAHHASRAHLGFALALSLLVAPSVVRADDGDDDDADDRGCHHVHGHFTSMPVPPPTCKSPVGFCTAGQLTGALRGGYSFTMTTATPSNAPTAPGVVFYTGASVITLARGGTVTATDTGAVDLNPKGTGKMVSLLTVDGGGYLQLRGSLDFATGGVSGDYVGEVCGR